MEMDEETLVMRSVCVGVEGFGVFMETAGRINDDDDAAMTDGVTCEEWRPRKRAGKGQSSFTQPETRKGRGAA